MRAARISGTAPEFIGNPCGKSTALPAAVPIARGTACQSARITHLLRRPIVRAVRKPSREGGGKVRA